MLEGGRLGGSLPGGMGTMVFTFHCVLLHFSHTDEFLSDPCLFLATSNS